MRKKHLILDIMGVLTQPTEIAAILAHLKQEGRKDIDYVEAEKIMEQWADDLDVRKLIFSKYLPMFNGYFKTNFTTAQYEALQAKGIHLNQELVDYCQKHKGEFKASLLSGNDHHNVVIYNKLYGFNKWSYKQVYSYKFRITKPDKRIFEIMLGKLNARPEECVFVDDLPRNVAAVEALGIHAILFKSNEQVFKELNQAFGIRV